MIKWTENDDSWFGNHPSWPDYIIIIFNTKPNLSIVFFNKKVNSFGPLVEGILKICCEIPAEIVFEGLSKFKELGGSFNNPTVTE
jgi:hypothetical protein